MNWEAIGAVGEIVGAAGVIFSVLYLAVQIRNSDRTARAESIQGVLRDYRTILNAPIISDPKLGDVFAKGVTDYQRLSISEQRQFFAMASDFALQLQNVMQLHQRGLAEETDFNDWLNFTLAMMRTPGGREVWKYIENVINPSVRDVINGDLLENLEGPSLLELQPFWRYDFEHETSSDLR